MSHNNHTAKGSFATSSNPLNTQPPPSVWGGGVLLHAIINHTWKSYKPFKKIYEVIIIITKLNYRYIFSILLLPEITETNKNINLIYKILNYFSHFHTNNYLNHAYIRKHWGQMKTGVFDLRPFYIYIIYVLFFCEKMASEQY